MTGSVVLAVFRREFASYFATPLAAVFLVIFLVLAGAFTFYLGSFFETNQADLQPFFRFHPWLYLLLAPALAMRLWAEERKSGSLELLLTLPLSTWQAVLGKFLAAWAFLGLALALTFPMWITVAWLGDPDHGVIFAGYLGSWLMAGAFLAIGSCVSATTRSQVIAFVLTVLVCLLLLLAGFPLALDLVRGWAPQALVDAVSGLSFLTHFHAIGRGVLDLRDVLFFLLSIVAWLAATGIVIELKKGG
jgi:ABC-2 type transport system permease protein